MTDDYDRNIFKEMQRLAKMFANIDIEEVKESVENTVAGLKFCGAYCDPPICLDLGPGKTPMVAAGEKYRLHHELLNFGRKKAGGPKHRPVMVFRKFSANYIVVPMTTTGEFTIGNRCKAASRHYANAKPDSISDEMESIPRKLFFPGVIGNSKWKRKYVEPLTNHIGDFIYLKNRENGKYIEVFARAKGSKPYHTREEIDKGHAKKPSAPNLGEE